MVIYLAFVVTFAVFIYLYFTSENDFFIQDKQALDDAWLKVEISLKNMNRSKREILIYKKAYYYFKNNPDQYDGSTFVRDLYIIRYWSQGRLYKLSVDSMLHDYEYLTGANRNWILNFKSNWRYFQNMRLNGKGVQMFRLIGLSIIGLIYVPIRYLIYVIKGK